MIYTSEEFFEREIKNYPQSTSDERLYASFKIMNNYREYYQTKIKELHPEYDEVDLKISYFKMMYGNEFSEEEKQKIFQSFREYHFKNLKS